MIDISLIQKFRDTVNDGFTFFRYRNRNDKNLWNCICSAMDWITVSVEYLERESQKSPRSMCSIEMYAYISSIDIVVEAIQQLHRVIFSTNKRVFEGDRDCFNDDRFGMTDLVYFKTIRACFGAHPVSLDEPGENNSKDKKRFACWSGSHYGEGDYSVILYSNRNQENDILLSIYLSQLNAFLLKNYNHLSTLNDALEEQYALFCADMRKTEFECSGNEIARLHALQCENELRLDNDYYKYTIKELIMIYSVEISCESNRQMVEIYRTALLPLIEEIRINLQDMEISNLSNDYLLHLAPSCLPNGWRYYVEKLTEHLNGGYPPFLWMPGITSCFGDNFTIVFDSYEELYVLIQASLYKMHLEEKANNND